MKEELKKLLQEKSEPDSFLQINELFTLHRIFCTPDNDPLKMERNIDRLMLEMTNKNANVRAGSYEIKARDTSNMMMEIADAMQKMLDEYKDNLVKRWRGGLL